MLRAAGGRGLRAGAAGSGEGGGGPVRCGRAGSLASGWPRGVSSALGEEEKGSAGPRPGGKAAGPSISGLPGFQAGLLPPSSTRNRAEPDLETRTPPQSKREPAGRGERASGRAPSVPAASPEETEPVREEKQARQQRGWQEEQTQQMDAL
ncbi:hypothetical protein NN561_014547 [Cricetulus griseus]